MPKAMFESPAACDVALWIVRHRPGITEPDLAEAMWGDRRRQPEAHQEVNLLEGKGLLERRRNTRPMTLHPISSGGGTAPADSGETQ